MENHWISRDYQPNDEQKIFDLFKLVFKKELDPEFWKWRFMQNPAGRGIIKLLFNGDRLIGHYAISRMRIQIGNSIAPAAFSMTTMTHPDYEKQGIFTFLAQRVYEKSVESGVKLVYGFPNVLSRPGFVNKLGWHDFGAMQLLEKSIVRSSAGNRFDFQKIAKFDERIDILWNMEKRRFPIIVPRTQKYLNWRFTEHPTVDYAKFIITSARERNNVLGYVVLKVYSEANIKTGHIIDWLCVENPPILFELLDFAENYFFKQGVQRVSCWSPDGIEQESIFCQAGFCSDKTETHFGVKVFDPHIDRISLSSKNWRMTMSDSDVY